MMAFLANRRNQLASAHPPFSPGFSTASVDFWSCSWWSSSSISSTDLPVDVLEAFVSKETIAWRLDPSVGAGGEVDRSSSTPNSVELTNWSIQLPRPNPRSRVKRWNSVSSMSPSVSLSESSNEDELDMSSSWRSKPSPYKPCPCIEAISARIRSSTKSGNAAW